MGLIVTMQLFPNTGLSSDYSRVFDITDFTNTGSITQNANWYRSYYRNKLDTMYGSRVVYPRKHWNFTHKPTTIEISINENLNYVTQYDYCSIAYEEETYFFFITDIEELNDTSPRIFRFHIKYDAWANNLYYLCSPTKTDRNMVVRQHLNGVQKYVILGETFYQYEIKNTKEIEPPVSITPSTEFKEPNDTQKLRVLYIKILFDRHNVGILAFDDNDNRYVSYSYNTYPSNGNIGVAYIPFCVVDTSTREYKKIDTVHYYRYSVKYFAENMSLYRYPNSTFGTLYCLPSFESSYILDASLTFNAPFNGTISETSTGSDRYNITYANTVMGVTLVYENEAVGEIPVKPVCTITGASDVGVLLAKGPFSKTRSIQFYHDSPTPYTKNNVFADSVQNYKDSRLLAYPYDYKSMTINNNVIPIIFNNQSPWSVFVRTDESAPHAVINNNLGLNQFRISLSNNGTYPTSLNALEEFKIANANKTSTKLSSLLLSEAGSLTAGVAGAITGHPFASIYGFSNAISNVSEMVNVGSQYKDLSNIGIAVSGLESNALNDMVLQDDVIIKHHQANSEEFVMKQATNILRLYGCNYNTEDSLKNNYRAIFDYKQTVNCSLPSIPSAYDRKEIESAYNRGITRWHIDAYGSTLQANREILKSYNDEINNVELGRMEEYVGV